MKNHVKEFLNYLKKETSLKIEPSPNHEPLKYLCKEGNPVDVDVLVIDGKMGLLVHSCGCNKSEEIIGLHILFGVMAEVNDAQKAMREIKKILPQIPISFIDDLEPLRTGYSKTDNKSH